MKKYKVIYAVRGDVVITASSYAVNDGLLEFFDEKGTRVATLAPGFWSFVRLLEDQFAE